MNKQSGFTLFELMISISIIAILSAIGIPAYQGYMQKAAMTDVLQTMVPYKTAVELCAIEQGALDSCQLASHGIPDSKTTRYVSGVGISKGAITLTAQQTLQGLSITMTPELNGATGEITWTRNCQHSAQNESQISACESLFNFDSKKS